MSPEQIEDLAFRGAPMPDGLDMAQQLLFQSFRYLYRYARLVEMPPEQGRHEKSAILREYEQRAFEVRWMEKTSRMWAQIEKAGSRFGRERTVEAAEAFYEAVYGAALKEWKEEKTNV